MDPNRANALSGQNARRILRKDSARALVYVWGGAHEAGSILSSPYSLRLRTKIQRVADTGEHREDVDLVRDFRSAFEDGLGALGGLAISADSDDTGGRVVASIADLVLE